MQSRHILLFSLILLFLAACTMGAPADNTLPPPTTDLQATVDTSIAATMQAEANLQTIIETAVAATVTAEQAAAEIPSEKEMVNEVDTAVEDVVSATADVAATTEEITADGTISPEEYAELEEVLVDAAILLDYAEYWVETYYWYYGDLAEETLTLLEELEDLLYLTEDNLDEIILLLETSTEIADTAFESLDQLSRNAEETASQLTDKAENWQTQLEVWQQTRAEAALQFNPSQIPSDRAAAIQEMRNYLDTIRGALEDQAISAVELETIAQIGANAVTGLESHGGIALQGLAANIDQLTQKAALGQFNQLAGSLGSFEAAIPNLQRP